MPDNTNPITALATKAATDLLTQLLGQLAGSAIPVVGPLVAQLLPEVTTAVRKAIVRFGYVGGIPPEELEAKAKAALARSADPDLVVNTFGKHGVPDLRDRATEPPPPPPPPPPPVQERNQLNVAYSMPIDKSPFAPGNAVWTNTTGNRWCVTVNPQTNPQGPKVAGTDWFPHSVVE